jgi:hypothetical protein
VQVAAYAVVVAAWLVPAAAVEPPGKDIPGSRFTYIHRLPLMNTNNEKPEAINPKDILPFSYRNTCTKCHDYNVIRTGWHFNAGAPKVDDGRPGEPWFWVDRRTATQIPVSSRKWPNVWQPAALGMTPWRFVKEFALHLPGGGPGEMTEVPDSKARWQVSGKLEINCAACHSGDASYDQIEFFLQVAGAQNLMWAPATTTEFSTLSGAAAKMPETFDPSMPPEDEAMAKNAPTVTYDKMKFDSKNRVFFNLPNEPPDTRCYFCHSLRQVTRPDGPASPEVWQTDVDVHTRAGLSCAACHRHGLDHAVRRGYEGEPGSGENPILGSLTCRGCHLGAESAAAGPETVGGRLGAPVPRHVGLPTLHLEKLACTTCHSGLYPTPMAGRIQTSRAHSLELSRAPFRGDDALPLIQEPVFVRQAWDGKIGPNRMVWPAFFGRLDGETVTPLSPDVVYNAAKDEFEKKVAGAKGVTAEQVAAALAVLGRDQAAKGEPIYVAGGKLYKRAADGKLEASDHPAAASVSWPIAHDVRPKSRSLGSGGCTDCHASEAPMAFGKVTAESPVDLGPPTVLAMYEFQGRNPDELRAWALSYKFRPMFKVVGFVTAGVIGGVLLLYLLLGLATLTRWAAKRSPQPPA